jgi:hypothetical protein
MKKSESTEGTFRKPPGEKRILGQTTAEWNAQTRDLLERARIAVRQGWEEVVDFGRRVRLDYFPLASGKALPLSPVDPSLVSGGNPEGLRVVLRQRDAEQMTAQRRMEHLSAKIALLRGERQKWRAERLAAEKRLREEERLAQVRQEELTKAQEAREKAVAEKIRLEQQVVQLQLDMGERGRLLGGQSVELDAERQKFRAAEARARQLTEETGQAREAAAALQTSLDDYRKRAATAEESWRTTFAQYEQLQERLNQQEAEAGERLRQISDLEAHLSATRALFEQEAAGRSQAVEALSRAEVRWEAREAREGEMLAQRWFPSFLGQGSLVGWRERLEREAQEGHTAAILTLAHLQISCSEARRSLAGASAASAGEGGASRTLLQALHELSRRLYEYLEKTDHPPTASATVATEWATALTHDLGGRINFRVAKPGEPVRGTWMLFHHGTTVRKALTWAVGSAGLEGNSIPADVEAGQHEPAAQRHSTIRTPTPAQT